MTYKYLQNERKGVTNLIYMLYTIYNLYFIYIIGYLEYFSNSPVINYALYFIEASFYECCVYIESD